MPDESGLNNLKKAGALLVSALAEEACLAQRSRKHSGDLALLDAWTQARQRVEDCQAEYYACLASADFPDLKIRWLIET